MTEHQEPPPSYEDSEAAAYQHHHITETTLHPTIQKLCVTILCIFLAGSFSIYSLVIYKSAHEGL